MCEEGRPLVVPSSSSDAILFLFLPSHPFFSFFSFLSPQISLPKPSLTLLCCDSAKKGVHLSFLLMRNFVCESRKMTAPSIRIFPRSCQKGRLERLEKTLQSSLRMPCFSLLSRQTELSVLSPLSCPLPLSCCLSHPSLPSPFSLLINKQTLFFFFSSLDSPFFPLFAGPLPQLLPLRLPPPRPLLVLWVVMAVKPHLQLEEWASLLRGLMPNQERN